MEDIQSWWEVPSIAYFCSLFRTAFNLLDFDIEELEEALLTDGTEDSASSLLTELIVRLLNGCLGNNDISAFNYQMYLRRLFRRKCQARNRYNPFNTDIDFQFLPLRTKVEILYALCDFRMDAEDVSDLFKNLEAESLRVEPLGYDSNGSAYWYFYGTRLYREDIIKNPKAKIKKKKIKENKQLGWLHVEAWLNDDDVDRVWQVVCFTEADWTQITEKFSKATGKVEKELYRSLSQNFLPEIPRLFQEKERLQRKRLMELTPRRTSSRVLQKIKQKEEETKQTSQDEREDDDPNKDKLNEAREIRATRRNLIRCSSSSNNSSDESTSVAEMPLKGAKRNKSQEKKSKNSSATHKGEPPPEPVKAGRKTNNSLASATGQILISDNEEPSNSTRKKLKTSQIFSQSKEDIQTDMYKVLEQLASHDDAWPFLDPVEEEYAPNYYTVIRRPMDLHKMEQRLDTGFYTDFSMFKADFKLIVNNCRLYNGQENEYTTMVENLQAAFERLTEKYMHRLSSSDEEIAVEFPLPTPSRKHKLKSDESPSRHKKKRRKYHSTSDEPKASTSSEPAPDDMKEVEDASTGSKESPKSKEGKVKKKHKSHRRNKHSKHHKKSLNPDGTEVKSSKHSKKKRDKSKDGKKSKQKKKKSKKSHEIEILEQPPLKRSDSQDSWESSNRSRSASPLPSIHTPTPSPEPETECDKLGDTDFFKDKYDKIKERRRTAAKDAWESLFDYKQKAIDKQKKNFHIPDKDKNQKLRETIEKLKAKNEKYKDSSLYGNIFPSTSTSHIEKLNSDSSNLTRISINDSSDEDFDVQIQKEKASKLGRKKISKKNTAKNESASEALEQAVKDISKLLDEPPKSSAVSSTNNSPSRTISPEEPEISRQDDESSQSEKGIFGKRDLLRKRPSSREPKVIKRREIQRTIDRLQPGKSKGNLLTNVPVAQKVEETAPVGRLQAVRDALKAEEPSSKLSLGSVLPTVNFSLGNDHNFTNDETSKDIATTITTTTESDKTAEYDAIVEKPVEKVPEEVNKVEEKPEVEEVPKLSQEKATPNLSAWFKAFGAPKSTPTVIVKKKPVDQDNDEKSADTQLAERKLGLKQNNKFDSPTDEKSPNPEGGDSPLPNMMTNPRQRRTSTGSSISERSSFSQDLDSPRHQMSHTSPLLSSPASPRTDEFQKITYPIINGTVRAGFYQDTASMKSSPEKSCSPREAPQSPFSQHVYSGNAATPNYFVDHNKSPLPTYGQNQPPPYYDTSKAPVVSKPPRSHDDYTALGPYSYNTVSQYREIYTQAPSCPYNPQSNPPSENLADVPAEPTSPTQAPPEPPEQKNVTFPVKKRTYTETDDTVVPSSNKKVCVTKEDTPNKEECQKVTTQPVPPIASLPSNSIDEIALALSEKSEMMKVNTVVEETAVDYTATHHNTEARPAVCENNDNVDKKKDTNLSTNKPTAASKKDNIDMINMGYSNAEIERHMNNPIDLQFVPHRDHLKSNQLSQQHKGYEVEAIAMNLGINSQQQQLQKPLSKPPITTNVVAERPAERASVGATHNPSFNEFENVSMSSQNVTNFSLNDIEIANKKLYACSATASNVDYTNWKLSSPIRKPENIPGYQAPYGGSDKARADIPSPNSNAVNYNKSYQQQQQYHNFSSPKTNLSRPQELQQSLPSELRIPNPRGLLKNDAMSLSLHRESEIPPKNIETSSVSSSVKSQKPEKLIQSHPLVGSLQFKPSYNTHSALQLESLRNLQSIPQMLERYTNDERYLSSFAAGSTSLYHDKSFQRSQMSQIYNKTVASDIHSTNTVTSAYSLASLATEKDANIYTSPVNLQSAYTEPKNKNKRKKTSEKKQTHASSSQAYHTPISAADVLSSVKSSMAAGSAFNFGAAPNIPLGAGLYGDNTGFSIEEFRNNRANTLIAANYMAAVAHQRNNTENSTEKLVKPAHQNSSHSSTNPFPFISHPQVRAGYPFVSADPSSPIYQQYLQRHQEELLRQTNAQIMGLYPPGYPGTLGVRQPYDSINRPSWI